jgi:nucleotide-binding universal stress UspA family protein
VNVRRSGLHQEADARDILATVAAASDELEESVSFELVETERSGRRSSVVAHELADYAAQHGIDLVVMGTHAWGTIGRLLLGSVAATIAQETYAPILMIPRRDAASHPVPRRMQHILVAVDRSPESELLVDDAAEIARLTGSSITLLNVVAPEPRGAPEMPLRHEEFVLRCARSEEHLDRLAEPIREKGMPVTAVTRADPSVAVAVRRTRSSARRPDCAGSVQLVSRAQHVDRRRALRFARASHGRSSGPASRVSLKR